MLRQATSSPANTVSNKISYQESVVQNNHTVNKILLSINTMRCAVCLEDYESRLHAIIPCKIPVCSLCIQSLIIQDPMKGYSECKILWEESFKQDYFEPQKSFFIWSRKCLQRKGDDKYWQEGILALNSTFKFYLDLNSNLNAQKNIRLQLKNFFTWLSEQLSENFSGPLEQKLQLLNNIFLNFEYSVINFEKISIGLSFFLKLGEANFHPVLSNSDVGWELNENDDALLVVKNHNSAINIIFHIYKSLENLKNVFSEFDGVMLGDLSNCINEWTRKNYIGFINSSIYNRLISQEEVKDFNKLIFLVMKNEKLPNNLLAKYVCLPFEWVRARAVSDYLTFIQSDSAILGLESIWFPHQLAVMFDKTQESEWLQKISNIISVVDKNLSKNLNAMDESINLITDQPIIIDWMKSLVLCKNIRNTIFLSHVLKLLESLKFLSNLEQSSKQRLENNKESPLSWPNTLKDFLSIIKSIYNLSHQLHIKWKLHWEKFNNAKGHAKKIIKNDLSILRDCISKSKYFFDDCFENILFTTFQSVIQSLQLTLNLTEEESKLSTEFFLNQIIAMKAFARFDKNDSLTVSKNFIYENLNSLFLISEKILNFERLNPSDFQLAQQLSDELCLVKNSIMISSDSAELIMPIFESLERALIIH